MSAKKNTFLLSCAGNATNVEHAALRRNRQGKTKEFTYNYVDRIRLGEGTLQSFKGPFRGSGWRPKSYSHLDLATSYRDAPSYLGHLQNRQLRSYRSLDCNRNNNSNESLNEFYWRLDSNDNYETSSPKQHPDHNYGDQSNYTQPSFPIPHHQQYQPLPFDIAKDLCSLRRSRSLAAIHEETFGDLQTSSYSRRSQLIPRAKLIDPVFLRRCNFRKEDLSNNYQPQERECQHESFCSPRESPILVKQKDNYVYDKFYDYSTIGFRNNQDLVNFQEKKHLLSYYSSEKLNWYNDRSDLESLNSDYFKNSLHQSRELQLQKTSLVAEPLCAGIEKQRLYKSQRNQRTSRILTKFTKERKLTTKLLSTAVGSTESCPENSQSSAIPETTTSNSDDQTDSPSLSERDYDVTETELFYHNSDSSKGDNGGIWEIANFCPNNKKCVNDCLYEVNNSLNGLIAYDSVFLSSEEGSEETVIVRYSDESQNKLGSETTSLLHISIHDKNLKPTAYQQLQFQEKIKPSEEDKVAKLPDPLLTPLQPRPETQPPIYTTNLKTIKPPKGLQNGKQENQTLIRLSDFSSRELTIKHTAPETCSYLSTPHTTSLIDWRQQGINSSSNISACPFRIKTPSVSSKGSLIDNQYHSLPDINIGRSLKVSERIDARLRSHYEFDYFSDQPKRNKVKESTCGKEENVTNNSEEAVVPANNDSIEQFGRACHDVREWENSTDHNTHVCQTDLPETVIHFDKEVESKYRHKTVEEKCFAHSCGQLNSANFSTVSVNKNVSDDAQCELINCSNALQKNKTENNYIGKSTSLEAFNKFKIVVTDSQENIIEEVSIDSLKPDVISEELFQSIRDNEMGDTLQLKQQENTGRDDVVRTKNKPLLQNLQVAKTPSSFFQKLSKMPRPQIVNIINSKPENSKSKIKSNYLLEKEYFQKVDAIRCYWSKLLQEDENNEPNEFEFEKTQPVRNCALTKEERNCESPKCEMQSFTPSIEIVELEGQQPATIFSAPVQSDANKQEFDHIRYKIMKPKLFCNNMIAHNKREAQFDGLIQYLQKYSFQELLSNNNVVIVEPVRTKIERTSKQTFVDTPKRMHTSIEENQCKKEEKDTFGTSATPVKSIKRHFFYQPVRVNRELYEEELPDPDTVRNVRKLFEQNILLLSGNKTCIMHPDSEIYTKDNKTISEDADDSHLKNNSGKCTQLTIDKSHVNTAATASNIEKSQKSAYPSASIRLSDQTVPEEFKNVHVKEFVRRHNNGFHDSNTYCVEQPSERSSRTYCASEENCCSHNSKHFEDKRNNYDENSLYNKEELCETYYVSKEILNKIRECGSSVTYYGGRMLNTTSPDTRMKKPKPKKFETYNTHPQKIYGNAAYSSNSGIKYKLVKSNSCNSRLELMGSHKTEHKASSIPKNSPTGRKEVHNLLKSKSTDSTTVPRIIESQCIHKSKRPTSINIKSAHALSESQINAGRNEILTINNQVVNKSEKKIGFGSSGDKLVNEASVVSTKISRNKNVDLAFTLTKSSTANSALTENDITLGNYCQGEKLRKNMLNISRQNEVDNKTKEFHESFVEQPNLERQLTLQEKDIENNEKKSSFPLTERNQNATHFENSFVRHYLTNDRRLLEKPKYDDVEFEEFEIYDPCKERQMT